MIIAVLVVCTVCVRLVTWINSVNTDRKSFEKSIDKMNRRITEIADRIDIKITQINDRIHDVVLWNRLPSKTVHMDSPLSLTDLDKRVAEHLNSSEIFDILVENVYERAKSLPPYDVQSSCFSYARNWTSPDEMALRIKDSAYQHSTAGMKRLRSLPFSSETAFWNTKAKIHMAARSNSSSHEAQPQM